jgi:hypothetical protein
MRKVALLLVLLAVPARAEIVRNMTPERVREALAWGAAQKEIPAYPLKSGIYGRAQRWAVVSTPFSRVAEVGHKAKREYATVDETVISADLLEPYVDILVGPRVIQPYTNRPARVIGVSKVVITGRNGTSPLQPLEQAPLVQSYGNLFGAEWIANAVSARFPLDVVRADTEVHVVYEDGDDVTFRFDLSRVR